MMIIWLNGKAIDERRWLVKQCNTDIVLHIKKLI